MYNTVRSRGFRKDASPSSKRPTFKGYKKSCATDKSIHVKLSMRMVGRIKEHSSRYLRNRQGEKIILVLLIRGPHVEMRGIVPWDDSRDGEYILDHGVGKR